ncbi:succinate dehydrogenase, hydrophobic membrane anchor protein [Legionella sp. CNM-1927-20]|uniref:succinate dehydrogenase, hydrophobic membrane anchor protein n=1 Tax=Legionella sp. CNM-1927-20 TaxID=3422221 RepID=UPI00403A9084
MVSNVTSLTGDGLKDWLIQRATAIYFALYCLFLFGFLLFHPHLQYQQWHTLFASVFFKTATIMALVALSLHTWIGVWTVTTDYVKSMTVRLFLQMIVLLWLSAQFIWGLMIVWGQ